MRFSSYLTAAFTAIGLITLSAQGAALTWDAGSGVDPTDWNLSDNWNPNQVPTLADDATIPTGYPNIQIKSANANANSVNIQGTSKVEVLGFQFHIDGGTSSTIAATDAIKLNDVNATLLLSASQTIGGAGSILLDDVGALMELSNGVTVTFDVTVHGFGSIAASSGGTATLFNREAVIADVPNQTLELFSSVILSDQDANQDSLWRVNASGATLKFMRDATLVGDVTVTAGTLSIEANVSFTGGTDAHLIFNGGTVFVFTSMTFEYDNYSGTCTNPDGSGPPYSLSAGTYNCS